MAAMWGHRTKAARTSVTKKARSRTRKLSPGAALEQPWSLELEDHLGALVRAWPRGAKSAADLQSRVAEESVFQDEKLEGKV